MQENGSRFARAASTSIAAVALGIIIGAPACLPGSSGDRPIEEGPQASAAARTTTYVHVEIPRVSLETYRQLATAVVHGTIVDSEVVLASASGQPYTEYRLAVADVLEGEIGGSIDGSGDPEIRVRLGSVDTPEHRVVVDHDPTLEVGDEVVLFVEPHDAGSFVILGLSQGTYAVSRDRDGHRVVDGLHATAQPLVAFAERLAPTGALVGSGGAQ